ncbi:MAG: sulfite exporter TauE/SafE family protein [Oscillospiraceae bacterium]|jgi:uncharacterized membrane protein YfcA|nr:sulfite exporter TauE/SafE family protein [Oscillospiraceae bacterium]
MEKGYQEQAIKSACAGGGAGLLSGLLGAGGGSVLVPLLRDWVGLDAKKAMATSVFCVAPICAVSAAAYAASGRVDWAAAAPYMLGGFLGGAAAGFLFAITPPSWLRRGFGVLLLLGAARQWFPTLGGEAPVWDGFWVSALAGAAAGVLSGLGLGGGTVLMIWMTLFGGFSSRHAAQGVNLLYFLPCSLGSMAGHIKNKQVAFKPALFAIAAGLPLGLLGAFIAQKLDASPLRIGFGVLMVFVGLREVLSAKQKEPVED